MFINALVFLCVLETLIRIYFLKNVSITDLVHMQSTWSVWKPHFDLEIWRNEFEYQKHTYMRSK